MQDELNDLLVQSGLEPLPVTDPCPSRTYWLSVLTEKPEVEKDVKEWERKLKQAINDYLDYFYQWFEHNNPHILFENEKDTSYFSYDNTVGVYVPITDGTVRGLIITLLENDGLIQHATRARITKITDSFRSLCTHKGVSLSDFDCDSDLIHCENGWLNLKTLDFQPNTPSIKSLRSMNVKYDPDAKCPLYDKFVDEDIHITSQEVKVLDEFSGLILTNDKRHQKMLTIIGRPGCGKSTLLEVWSHILGERGTQKSLSELSGEGSRFDGDSFLSRSLVWFDEVDVKRAEMGDKLGKLVTGKKVTIERKGIQGRCEVDNYVKCVLTANSLPMSSQTGLFRRILHINFTHSFTDTNTENINIYEEMVKESSGILNRMIQGYKRLCTQGTYTSIDGHDEFIEEYKATADVASEFLSTYFVYDPSVTISNIELYQAFVSAPVGRRYSDISPQKFSHLLQASPLKEFSNIKRIRDEKGARAWKGIALTDQYEFDTYGRIVKKNEKFLVAPVDPQYDSRNI